MLTLFDWPAPNRSPDPPLVDRVPKLGCRWSGVPRERSALLKMCHSRCIGNSEITGGYSQPGIADRNRSHYHPPPVPGHSASR